MTGNEALLLVTLALHTGTLLHAGHAQRAAEQANDHAGSDIAPDLQRRQWPVSVVYILAVAAALWWRVADGYVVVFAMAFVLAQVVHAALFNGDNTRQWSDMALKASAVALTGLVAMLALDILPPQADTMVVP